MRTTIDIPDDLYQKVEALAATRGVELAVFIEETLRRSLADATVGTRRIEFPILKSARPGSLSLDEAHRAEEQQIHEEDRMHGSSP